MKRQSLCTLPFFILAFTLISCDPCANVDCIYGNHYGQFRIVSKTDGEDLVFGPNAIYDKTKIKFYSLNGTDTISYQYEPEQFQGRDFEGLLHVKFYPETTTLAYIKLNNIDIDTLTITYSSFNSECCGMITDITKFKYNDVLEIPASLSILEIKK